MNLWWCRPGIERMRDMAADDRKKSNLRMGLILASIALAFFFGFMIKIFLLSHS
jgi:hypothetical protein